MYFQAYTLYSSVRPFGLSAIVAGWDSHPDDKAGLKAQGKPALYVVEPSGVFNVRSSSILPSLIVWESCSYRKDRAGADMTE